MAPKRNLPVADVGLSSRRAATVRRGRPLRRRRHIHALEFLELRTLLNAAPVASDDTYPAEFQTALEVQTATRPLPRHSFVDTFSGDRLSPNLTDAAQVFVVADGVLSQRERRKYVTTKKTDYVTGDFLIELDVDLTTTANVIEFVGIGPGEPRGAYNEPEGSLYLRMHSVSFGGMMIVSAAGGFGGTEFGTITQSRCPPRAHRKIGATGCV